MSSAPLVTVLMSVFNESVFLPDAVGSILRQTLADFEFLIIDDGCTDECASFLASLRDPRVRVVRNGTNLGLTHSLRRGVELSRGRYLARMDADDIAFRDRLREQVEFLESHQDVVLLGGACVEIDEHDRTVGLRQCPENDLEIRWTGLLTSPFLHPSAMIRRQALVEKELNYDPRFVTAQDYDLWMRLLKVGQGANLRHPLIQYRLRSGAATRQRREQQLNNTFQIAARTIAEEFPGTAIEPEQVALIWTTFLVPGCAGVKRDQWKAAVHLSRDLFARFDAKYRNGQNNSRLTRLRRRHAGEIARSMLRLRGPPGWRPALIELMREDAGLPFWCCLKLLGSFVARFKRSSYCRIRNHGWFQEK